MPRPLPLASQPVYLSVETVAKLMDYPDTPAGHENCRRVLVRMCDKHGIALSYFGREIRVLHTDLANMLHPKPKRRLSVVRSA